ncbi:MAG: hypothetical protein CMH57_05300 [Myxococcales bacterium]|nr:hypothetical protein [Myxococcales bacterium]
MHATGEDAVTFEIQFPANISGTNPTHMINVSIISSYPGTLEGDLALLENGRQYILETNEDGYAEFTFSGEGIDAPHVSKVRVALDNPLNPRQGEDDRRVYDIHFEGPEAALIVVYNHTEEDDEGNQQLSKRVATEETTLPLTMERRLPDQNLYVYALRGQDDDWGYIENASPHRVTLTTDLSSGIFHGGSSGQPFDGAETTETVSIETGAAFTTLYPTHFEGEGEVQVTMPHPTDPDGAPLETSFSYVSSAEGFISEENALESITAGANTTCVMGSEDQIVCWGAPMPGRGIAPGDGTGRTSFSVGFGHACVIQGLNEVRCWGDDMLGQATPPSRIRTYRSVSAGLTHTCAIRSDGALECWGASTPGLPTEDPGPFAAVSVGLFHMCVLGEGGAECWTANPLPVGEADPPEVSLMTLSAGAMHNCGLTAEGEAICWGVDDGLHPRDFGQVRDTPADTTFTQLAVGAQHNCGLTDGGDVVCWGDDTMGQATPPELPEGSAYTGVACGEFHSCAIIDQASVVCWGAGTMGQTTPPAALTQE